MTIWIVTQHCLNKTHYKHPPTHPKFLRIKLYQSIKSMHFSFSLAELCTKCPSFFYLFFLLSNVTCTNIFLRISFHHTWMDLFESHVCLTMLVLCTYMYIHGINLFLMLLHICRFVTALILCLLMHIISVRSIAILICVCSIARSGCYTGPNGPNATILVHKSF